MNCCKNCRLWAPRPEKWTENNCYGRAGLSGTGKKKKTCVMNQECDIFKNRSFLCH